MLPQLQELQLCLSSSSLSFSCQTGSKTPHALVFWVLVLWIGTKEVAYIKWVEPRIFTPGLESGATVYDMKKPHVSSAHFSTASMAHKTNTHTHIYTCIQSTLAKQKYTVRKSTPGCLAHMDTKMRKTHTEKGKIPFVLKSSVFWASTSVFS